MYGFIMRLTLSLSSLNFVYHDGWYCRVVPDGNKLQDMEAWNNVGASTRLIYFGYITKKPQKASVMRLTTYERTPDIHQTWGLRLSKVGAEYRGYEKGGDGDTIQQNNSGCGIEQGRIDATKKYAVSLNRSASPPN
eukprot:IDg7725t1